ncbi:MAG TPA: response regulator [Candidatus Nitrosotenuis sp.]|nr:response regulator [Candidatus Nitrosotenuis sp.]
MAGIEEKDVLVIEDSPAVGIILKEFLGKLGLKKIHYCQNGKTGIDTFKELVASGNLPLVFLDYNLPDMTAYSIMTQMLSIRPDVKVIIETARDKTEDSIKDVIAQGAYQYLGKPIRLERLKEIIETLKAEESHPMDDDISNTIEKLISNTTQISILRISQYLGKQESEILPYIKRLISDKKIMQINDIKEVGCPRCSAVRVTQTFHCPKCRGTNFKQDKIIEHYKCGNVSSASSYLDDKCPKCHETIKVFGVDYRVQENYYMCNDCGEIFAEILTNYLCLKCNNKFTLEHARLLTSSGYTWSR